jgi:Rps23 Pro-64 3,4-dihydroxylase Tpa1-like proline 4-hydroxylase
MNIMNQRNEIIDFESLSNRVKEDKELYSKNTPYPHIVMDDVFETRVLEQILEEFENAEKQFLEFDNLYEKKLQMNKEEYFGEMTRRFIHYLNSSRFLACLEELTGINGLIPDPHLSGGGLHKIPRGGRLGIHVDFNRYKSLNLYRRVNVLVYLNKDWQEEFGGHFELWSDNKGTEKKRVLPVFNRMAIFTTTRKSFHGHPEPLTCPEGVSRRSIAMYYYTAGDKGDQSSKEHSTIFLDKKGKEDELGKSSFVRRVKSKVKNLVQKLKS